MLKEQAQRDVRAAVRAADLHYFESNPNVCAFKRPFQPGEAGELNMPTGSMVLVDCLGTRGSIRRWVIPPPDSGLGKVCLT
jgi:hypothetical protein